jgi:hypothetical protein
MKTEDATPERYCSVLKCLLNAQGFDGTPLSRSSAVNKNMDLLARGVQCNFLPFIHQAERVVITEMDEDLDLRSHDVFVHACKLA